MSESWSVASQSWDELTNKPAVLADNIIDWNEINNRPDVQVLADNINYILNNYSLATHSHSSLYSPLSHNHNSAYSSLSHTHSQYSSTTHNHALSALTDTTFTSLTSGQLMRFDGTKWINFSPDYAAGNHDHNSTYSPLSHTHNNIENGSALISTNQSGDLSGIRYGYANQISMSHAQTSRNSDNIFYSSSDNFIRKNTAAGVIASLGLDSKYLKSEEIEEGTFTPTLRTVQNTSQPTYSSRDGYYFKINKMIFFTVLITFTSSLTASTEQIAITLPFSALTGFFVTVNIFQFSGFSISTNQRIIGTVVSNLVRLWVQDNVMSSSTLMANTMNGNGTIRLNGTFCIS